MPRWSCPRRCSSPSSWRPSFATAVAAQRPTRTRYAIAGALWGLATLTRTAALPVPIVLAVLLFVAFLGKRRAHLTYPAIMLAAFLLVLSPWAVRNAVSMDTFTPTPSQGGIALWAASLPDAQEFIDRHMAYAWELPEFHEITQGKHPSDPAADQRLTSAAIDNIKANPLGWVDRNATKLAIVVYQSMAQELADAARVRELSGGGSFVAKIVTGASVLALLLIVVGAISAAQRNRLVVVPLVVVATIYAAQFPVFAEARYFLPLAPLYALFLASGLAVLGPPIKAWLDGAAEQGREREAEKEG